MTSLTAAHPPGNTPATRTGESPRSVSPSPASPRTKHAWRRTQRFRAANTDSGPFTRTTEVNINHVCNIYSTLQCLCESYQSLEDISHSDAAEIRSFNVRLLLCMSCRRQVKGQKSGVMSRQKRLCLQLHATVPLQFLNMHMQIMCRNHRVIIVYSN